ncbi:MAG TPA: GGDEF domain-containing protein [Holophagaceae bacterium]|nr:GGDEF domain-containing protein [Holophagaceae bacterium]
MPNVQPSPDDLQTLVSPPTGSHVPAVFHDWALIRYVGQPIGELVPIPLDGLIIGRAADCGLSLPEAEVSRNHSRISLVLKGESVVVHLQDLGSTNGTFVNGRRLDSEVHTLLDGDVVRVGAHAFKLKKLDEMERVYHQAVLAQTTVDPLTGVSNRATVLHHLEKHFELARRHRRPLSVILADLDHFKRINDQYGHPAGDAVLQTFGIQLLGRLRGSDHVGRIGGEEFLVVLPETVAREAIGVADDLRQGMEEDPVALPGSSNVVQATCSLGVAELRDSDTDAGSLLARVDVALYRAKAAGRNRVERD